MRKIITLTLIAVLCAPLCAYSAVRDETTVNRQKNETSSRSATVQKSVDRGTAGRTVTNTSSREISNRNITESAVSRSATARTTATAVTARTAATPTVARSARTARIVAPVARAATTKAARTAITPVTQTFGTGYNSCRDAYFTCMDQFCAHANEDYRRCACSSRLEEIKTKERALGQTAQQLQDFKDLNIDSISKTSEEVKAMLTATPGEYKQKSINDTSASSDKLAGISAVLNKTKTQSLSTAGKLDIAGDINSIWATTDLAGGADIINLTGESLYNAVHAQCSELAAADCESRSTMNMVVAAYGMYIENDCTTLSNALAKKTTAASGSIRETEREMNVARLENYNAHNSTSINDCIAQVRKDITSESACGKDYVHCLDITGKYLNNTTGEPIYSPNFYQLELQTSLTGDVLTNQTNRVLVAELNRRKEFARRGLDTCRDLANDVWSEFMRQAIAEIYQGQQERIRLVKNECIDVVNNCYDSQSKSLKDFSNVKEQLLLGARLELSEQMCQEKLDACSNLYGGGTAGLIELVSTMKSITEQKIAKDCKATLEEYAIEICATPSSDIVHAYPFACRTYAPGEQKWASVPGCNSLFANKSPAADPILGEEDTIGIFGFNNNYQCVVGLTSEYATFIECNPGYYMTKNGRYNGTASQGNRCTQCPSGYECIGGTADKTLMVTEGAINVECGEDYAGSLYQKLVRYAMQTCVRPSEATNDTLPISVLGDVNTVMDKIKVSMGTQLSAECERLGGIWVDTPAKETSTILEKFYTETSSNRKWGYCRPLDTTP